jgi:hypothetical protein
VTEEQEVEGAAVDKEAALERGEAAASSMESGWFWVGAVSLTWWGKFVFYFILRCKFGFFSFDDARFTRLSYCTKLLRLSHL